MAARLCLRTRLLGQMLTTITNHYDHQGADLDDLPVEKSVAQDFVGWGFTPRPDKYPTPGDIGMRLVAAGTADASSMQRAWFGGSLSHAPRAVMCSVCTCTWQARRCHASCCHRTTRCTSRPTLLPTRCCARVPRLTARWTWMTASRRAPTAKLPLCVLQQQQPAMPVVAVLVRLVGLTMMTSIPLAKAATLMSSTGVRFKPHH